MSYVEIVNLVFSILTTILGLFVAHYVIFAVAGVFARKKFPKTEDKCRIGIIVSARNEEKVIGNLIESIRACDYPQDKIDIFVVAHNCTDKTAEICRGLNSYCYEYNNPEERRVGYAYRYLFGRIEQDYGTQNYDAFIVMNADDTVTANYMQKMNDAFVACERKNIITSFRNTSNFGQNYMTCMYGLMFASTCRYENRGRTVCNCSTRVLGTGYMFPASFVKDGWEYITITEDLEFSADKVLHGAKVYYCDEAEFFDEQPTTIGIMVRQRLRWAKGHIVVFFSHFGKLIASIFNPHKYGGEKNYVISKYDGAMTVSLLGMTTTCLTVLQIILLAFCPLFGENAWEVFKDYLISSGFSLLSSYCLMLLSGIFVLILEHKRMRHIGFFKLLAGILLFPLFMGFGVILDVVAFFKKRVEWKPIPHYGNND